MKLLTVWIAAFALVIPAAAQDWGSWESLAQLKTGDRVRVSLMAGKPVDGEFQNWDAERITIGTASTKKSDVRKVERYRPGGSHRGKSAAIGAAIGFGGGFVLGATVGGCRKSDFICFGRAPAGAAVGTVGAVIGGLAGALMPRGSKTVIYRRVN